MIYRAVVKNNVRLDGRNRLPGASSEGHLYGAGSAPAYRGGRLKSRGGLYARPFTAKRFTPVQGSYNVRGTPAERRNDPLCSYQDLCCAA